MASISEEIRKNIEMLEYNVNLDQSESPKDFDSLKLTKDQRTLVKALYETTLFSVDHAMADLREMLSRK